MAFCVKQLKRVAYDVPKMDAQRWIDRNFAVVFPVYLFLLWLAVSATVSYLGGWRALSKAFRVRSPFAGPKWRLQSGRMRGLGGYNNCLTVGANSDGLYLGMIFFLRFMHPPLFIPWSEVSVRRKRIWILGERVTLTLGREIAIPFTIGGRLAGKLKAAAGNAWPLEAIQP